MGRDPDRDSRQGWVPSRLPGNADNPARAVQQARPRAQSWQIWWLWCPRNVMPMWAASSFLSPPRLASGLGRSALSTNSTAEPGQAVRGMPPEGRPARSRRMPGARPCSLVRALHQAAALPETPSLGPSPSVSPSGPPLAFPCSQWGVNLRRCPPLPTPPAQLPLPASHTPAAERGGKARGRGIPDPPGTRRAAVAPRGWICTTWDGNPCSSKALAVLAW